MPTIVTVNARRLSLGVSALALSVGLALGASPASAQQAPAAQTSNTIGEVVVTAQFRSQNVQQTPIAITAVNAQMLENRGQTSIEQVANQAPNVTLKPAGAAFGPSLAASIRGVGQYDFDPALEPGVGMYVDDVYYSTLTGSILDLLDLDRVEILRGPQGTLAGMNSIGGSVKLYSKQPNATEGGYLEGTYGSLNRLEARGAINFALVPDQLFVRLSAVTNHYDGYVTRYDYGCLYPSSGIPNMVGTNSSCQTGKEGGKSYSAVRLAVRWAPNEKLNVNLLADYTYDNSENAAETLIKAVPLAPGPAALTSVNGVTYGPQFIPSNPYVSYASFYMPAGTLGPFHADALTAPDTSQYKGWGVSGTIDYKFTDTLSLKSITAFRGYTSDWAEDNDTSPLPLGLGLEHLAHQQISEELRLNGSLGKMIDYTLGGFYFVQKTTYATHQDLWYPGIILDFLGNDPVPAHTYAGFGQATWHITDRLNLTGGVRYTEEAKDYSYVRNNRDGTPNLVVGALDGHTGHYSGTHVDWRVDADYRWTRDFMTYAEASTGFRGGGVNPRPFSVPQVQPFGAETLTAYEVGFKSQWLDRHVRLNVAAFYNKYKGIQLTLLSCPQFGGPGPCALPTNAGDAIVKGAEAEAEVHPFGGMELDGSLSYLKFNYIGSSFNPNQVTGITVGMTTPYTPKWKWSFGAQYAFEVGDKGSLTPRVDVSYQDSVYTNALNGPNNFNPGYTVANARLTWRSATGGWEAALDVTNFTNKLYYLTTFDLSATGGGSVQGQPGMPREWTVSLKKSF